jgi:hypothetical protein
MYHCAQDIIEYLMASVGGGAQDSEHRMLRAAAGNAYRDVVHAREWKWHETETALPEAEADSGGKAYILPAGVTSVDSLIAPDRTTETSYITYQEYVRMEAYVSSYGDTIYWTTVTSTTRPDRLLLLIAGIPPSVDASRHDEYFVTYRRKPPALKYMGYEKQCRDNSLDASSAPGAVKRYGTADRHPEGPNGIHPYTAEEVLGVSGSLIGTPPDNARTVVSDRLDVADYMLSAVLSGAEAWLARLQGKNVEGALTVHSRDMRMAMEADSSAPMSGRRRVLGRYPENVPIPFAGNPSTARTLGYYSPSQPDTGT